MHPVAWDMRKTISLVLPILVPSWRFFKTVEPSPRIQWGQLTKRDGVVAHWQEFQPRPQTVTPIQMISRLFWNAARNDALFMVSCAERLHLNPTDHSLHEIKRRLFKDIHKATKDTGQAWFQFRLIFVQRADTGLTEDVVFLSETFRL